MAQDRWSAQRIVLFYNGTLTVTSSFSSQPPGLKG